MNNPTQQSLLKGSPRSFLTPLVMALAILFLKTITLTIASAHDSLTPYTEPSTPHTIHTIPAEMGGPETPAHPILPIPSTPAYDITPYQDMTDKALFALLMQKEEFYTRLQPGIIPCEIDDHWKTACDIYQALIQKRPEDRSYEGYYKHIDGAFTGIKAQIRELTTIGDYGVPIYDHLPLGSLCHAWKQAAWVDPNDTDAFIRLLETGYEGPIRSDGQRDLIPQRADWLPYWKHRGATLRAQPHWHIPESETDPAVRKKVRQRFEEYGEKLRARQEKIDHHE